MLFLALLLETSISAYVVLTVPTPKRDPLGVGFSLRILGFVGFDKRKRTAFRILSEISDFKFF